VVYKEPSGFGEHWNLPILPCVGERKKQLRVFGGGSEYKYYSDSGTGGLTR
jgi:hypothetical protein